MYLQTSNDTTNVSRNPISMTRFLDMKFDPGYIDPAKMQEGIQKASLNDQPADDLVAAAQLCIIATIDKDIEQLCLDSFYGLLKEFDLSADTFPKLEELCNLVYAERPSLWDDDEDEVTLRSLPAAYIQHNIKEMSEFPDFRTKVGTKHTYIHDYIWRDVNRILDDYRRREFLQGTALGRKLYR